MNKAKLDHRLASSNLRILLNHPQIASGVERFKRVYFYGTDYIYNTRRGNIIATIRQSNTKTLLRYRPASYYASILEEFGNRSGYVTIASTNVGRAQRRIAREEGNTSAMDRKYALKNLAKKLKKPKFYDALSSERQAPADRETRSLADSIRESMSSIELNVNEQSAISNIFPTSFPTDSGTVTQEIQINPLSQFVTSWGHVIVNEDNMPNTAIVNSGYPCNYRIHEGIQYIVDAQGGSAPAAPFPIRETSVGNGATFSYNQIFQRNYMWQNSAYPQTPTSFMSSVFIDEADQTTESS